MKTIQAVYEDGVLKPLQKVRLREHEKVELQIFSPEEWQSRRRQKCPAVPLWRGWQCGRTSGARWCSSL